MVYRGQRTLAAYVVALAAGCMGCIAVPEAGPQVVSGAQTEALLYAHEWLWPSTSVPVCWEDPDALSLRRRNLVRTAAQSTWSTYSAVSFEGWGACEEESRGIRIGIADEWPRVEDFGKNIDGLANGMVLNFSFQFTEMTGGRGGCAGTVAVPDSSHAFQPFAACVRNVDGCASTIAVHEFGHALGFGHEQDRADSPSDWFDVGCTRTGTVEHHSGTETLGSPDTQSVMNACNPAYNNGGYLSDGDILGVRELYGPGTLDLFVPMQTTPQAVAALDIDNDGLDEVALASTGTGGTTSIGIYRVDARSDERNHGWALVSEFPVGGRMVELAGVRLGSELRPRLLVSRINQEGQHELVLLREQDGAWAASAPWLLDRPSPVTVTSGDVDGDGDSEVAVCYGIAGARVGATVLDVLEQGDSARYTRVGASYETDGIAISCALADSDGDSADELTVAVVVTAGAAQLSLVELPIDATAPDVSDPLAEVAGSDLRIAAVAMGSPGESGAIMLWRMNGEGLAETSLLARGAEYWSTVAPDAYDCVLAAGRFGGRAQGIVQHCKRQGGVSAVFLRRDVALSGERVAEEGDSERPP